MSAIRKPIPLVVKRRIVTARVKAAQDELRQALNDSIADSGLFRDEAEAKLSLLLAFLWDDLEPAIKQLPVQRDASRLGLVGVIPIPRDEDRKTGRPRKDEIARREAERLSL